MTASAVVIRSTLHYGLSQDNQLGYHPVVRTPFTIPEHCDFISLHIAVKAAIYYEDEGRQSYFYFKCSEGVFVTPDYKHKENIFIDLTPTHPHTPHTPHTHTPHTIPPLHPHTHPRACSEPGGKQWQHNIRDWEHYVSDVTTRQHKVLNMYGFRQTSNIRRTNSHDLNVSRLVLQLYLPNLLKPGVKSKIKM